MSNSRNPWPLAITGFFVTIVVLLAGYVVFAFHQRQDLVASNYYDNEIRYQQQLDRLNHTQPLGDTAKVDYDAAQNSIVITLPPAPPAAQGQVTLYRPDDARLDCRLPLAVNAAGVQRLDAKGLRAGQWKVRVTWSAGGQEFFLDRAVVVEGRS
jgi:nitrogen fixation protein FixH